jgi:hypothetical protein
MDMLIAALAALLGISPAAAVGLLVAASVGGSAALRWYRRMRHEENYYLELTRTGGPFGSPEPSPEERRLLRAADPSRSGRLRRRMEKLGSS